MTSLGEALNSLTEEHPILIGPEGVVTAGAIRAAAAAIDLTDVTPGTPVALIGGYEPWSIACLVRLADHGCILLPLTPDTATEHQRLFKIAGIRFVAREGDIQRLTTASDEPALVRALAHTGRPGLILFSTGTTGDPKAVLHDLTAFLRRYEPVRRAWRTAAFLLFDHLGGVDPLLRTLLSGGSIIVPPRRDPPTVFETIARHKVALLPTSPSFLRHALRVVNFDRLDLSALEIITFGAEPMDEPTLRRLVDALPGVEIRQTYDITELGVLKVRRRGPERSPLAVRRQRGIHADHRRCPEDPRAASHAGLSQCAGPLR